MTATRIEDLANVEVEHLLGMNTGLPLVKLRAESTGTVLVAQLEPAQARQIAMDLLTAAARAEYEHDLVTGGAHLELPTEFAMVATHVVRVGERLRCEGEAR